MDTREAMARRIRRLCAERGVTLVTAERMQIISDKRSREKNKR